MLPFLLSKCKRVEYKAELSSLAAQTKLIPLKGVLK